MQCVPSLRYVVGIPDNRRDHVYVVVLACLGRSDDEVSDLWESAEFVECFHLVSDDVNPVLTIDLRMLNTRPSLGSSNKMRLGLGWYALTI